MVANDSGAPAASLCFCSLFYVRIEAKGCHGGRLLEHRHGNLRFWRSERNSVRPTYGATEFACYDHHRWFAPRRSDPSETRTASGTLIYMFTRNPLARHEHTKKARNAPLRGETA